VQRRAERARKAMSRTLDSSRSRNKRLTDWRVQTDPFERGMHDFKLLQGASRIRCAVPERVNHTD
jgi:hypothetical protein